jgi:hypothetical protein
MWSANGYVNVALVIGSRHRLPVGSQHGTYAYGTLWQPVLRYFHE